MNATNPSDPATAPFAWEGLIIRRADVLDTDILADLVTQLGYPTEADTMLGRLRSLLSRPQDHLVAVAEWKGCVVGVIVATFSLHIELDGTYGFITALSVDERHRGQGIGAALLTFAETWLHRLDAGVCIVNSHIRRLDAHRFYEREGYQRTGHRFEKKWR